jgi:hypothetical protein
MKCDHCGAPGAPLRCGRCRDATYCSQHCQRAAWKAHKVSCRTPHLMDSPREASGASAKVSDAAALLHLDSHGFVEALELAARSDSLADFTPLSIALVHNIQSRPGDPPVPPLYIAQLAKGLLIVMGGPTRSAAITASLCHILGTASEKDPLTVSDALRSHPGVLVDLTRRHIDDETVVTLSLGLVCVMCTRECVDRVAHTVAFAASNGLPLIKQVLDLYTPRFVVGSQHTHPVIAALGIANCCLLRAPGAAPKLAQLGLTSLAVEVLSLLVGRSFDDIILLSVVEVVCAIIGNIYAVPGQGAAAVGAGAISSLLALLPTLLDSLIWLQAGCAQKAASVVAQLSWDKSVVPRFDRGVALALLKSLKAAVSKPRSLAAAEIVRSLLCCLDRLVHCAGELVPLLLERGIVATLSAAVEKHSSSLVGISEVAESIRGQLCK